MMAEFFRLAEQARAYIVQAIKEHPEIEEAAWECLKRLLDEWGPKWAGASRGFKPAHAVAWVASIVYNILRGVEDECRHTTGRDAECLATTLVWLAGMQQIVADALAKPGKKEGENTGGTMFM